ncbi:MAG: TIGR00725 family protein [archaeon]
MDKNNIVRRQKIIAVIGHASHAEKRHIDTAYEVGKEIAKQGAILITGGNSVGVPNAAARGAKCAGGISIGITPSSDGHDTSQYLTIPIHTGMGFARNQILGLTADALIAIGGGVGTFCEMAYSYVYKKPIIVITNQGGLPEQYAGKYLDEKKTAMIHEAKTPKKAVELAIKLTENPKIS